MRTTDNRLMVLALSTRAAAKNLVTCSSAWKSPRAESEYQNVIATLAEIADQLDAAARAPAGDATAKADPSPSDGWAALDWYFENVYSTDERIDNEAGVTLHWVNLRTNKAEQTKGANWREAITKAMAEAKASEQGSEAAT